MRGKPRQSNAREVGCEDLKPILTILETEYGIRVISERIVDPKSGDTEILVMGNLSPQIIKTIKDRTGENPNLVFGSDTIACNSHYVYIASGSSAISGETLISPVAVNIFQLVVALIFGLGGIALITHFGSTVDLRDLLAGVVMVVMGGFGVIVAGKELRTKINNSHKG